MQGFIVALILSALPVISNFIGAMLAEALPLSKQTLGLALHAASGVLLAIAFTELLPQVVSAKPIWATVISMFLGGAFYVGTLLTALVEDIIPEAHQTQDTNWSTLTFIGNFTLSILFANYLG